MKKWVRFLCIISLLVVSGCNAKEGNGKEEQSFWLRTLDAIEKREDAPENWDVEYLSEKEAKEHNLPTDFRNVMFRKKESGNVKNNTNSISFGLSGYQKVDENDKGQITYTFLQKENVSGEFGDKIIEHELYITSKGNDFRSYHLTYTKTTYANEEILDSDSAYGSIKINKEDQIEVVPVPMLKEAIQSFDTFLNEIQTEYDFSWEGSDFVNLPTLMKSVTYDDGSAQYAHRHYYDEGRITAKGYTLYTHLKVAKDYSDNQLGTYSYEQQTYNERYNLRFEQLAENLYQMYYPDHSLAQRIYFHEQSAYLYDASMSNEAIINDVLNHNGAQAEKVLVEKELE